MQHDQALPDAKRVKLTVNETSTTTGAALYSSQPGRQQQEPTVAEHGLGGSRGAAAPAGDADALQPHSWPSANPAAVVAGQRHAKPHAAYARAPAAARTALPSAPSSTATAATAAAGLQQNQNSSGPLLGLTVYLHGSIPLLQKRLKLVTKRLVDLGAAALPPTTITASSTPNSLANITHIVLHPSDADVASAAAGSGGGGGSSCGGGASRSATKQSGPAAVQQVVLLVQQRCRQQRHQQKASRQQLQQQHDIKLVSDAWLDAVLSTGQYIPEEQYSLSHLLPDQQTGGGSSSVSDDSDGAVSSQQRNTQQQQHQGPAVAAAAGGQGSRLRAVGPRFLPDLDPSPDAPMGRFATWLGHWQPSNNSITAQVELVLHGSYSESASLARGPNEAVRKALKELEHYETAVAVRDVGGWGPGTIAHEALTYAHAAAIVRGCSFPLSASLSPSRLQKLLPFVGAFTAKIIHQLLATGSCEQLEAFRHDQPVRNSQGQVRPATGGGATRALFVKLPGVGPTLAERWFSLGFRSLEALLEAAANAGLLGVDKPPAGAAAGQSPVAAAAAATSSSLVQQKPAGGASSASTVQGSGSSRSQPDPDASIAGTSAVPFGRPALYSLQYSSDLLAAVVHDELQEMQQYILAALASMTGVGSGWQMQIVGGGRRDGAVHDADFLISHPDGSLIDGLVEKVYSHLVAAGRLVPDSQGFCRLQKGRMPGYKSKARSDVLLGRFDHNHQMDHYDHIWGIYITPAGRRRRIDLMFIPPHSWIMALVGWTGSKQYLRFMRQHAGNIGMHLNSHYLMRKVELRPGTAAAAGSAGVGLGGSSSTGVQQQDGSGGGRKSDVGSTGPEQQAPSATVGASAAGCTQSAAADTLADTLEYVGAAASSGSSHVVLSVPDEAPPIDRSRKEWWPAGWSPGTVTAAAAAAGTAGGAGAASTDRVSAAPTAGGIAGDLRTQLCSLVAAGPGSDRDVAEESDLFELLGIRYLLPGERNC